MRERMRAVAAWLAGPVAVGVVLGLIGPFGTYQLLPVLPRLGFWLAVVGVNWLLCDIAIRRIEALVPEAMPLRRAAVPLVGAALVSLPATGVVAMSGALAGLGWPGDLPALFAKVALLLAAIALPAHALADLQEAAAAPAAPPDPAPDTPAAGPRADIAPAPRTDPGPGPRAGAAPRTATHAAAPAGGTADAGAALFLARLPGPPTGRLLCLEMQDHYLAVHTTAGSTLILCRMEDAARELRALGRRVHRSWWVAADALEGVERDGQRLFLRLRDGRRVPVGRTYRRALTAEGWLPTRPPGPDPA